MTYNCDLGGHDRELCSFTGTEKEGVGNVLGAGGAKEHKRGVMLFIYSAHVVS
jgi:hypothetical protein